MLFIAVGLPGVGKTSVLKGVIERAKDDGIKVSLVNFGDIMLEEGLKKQIVKDRDEIRKLKTATQRYLQKLAAKRIKEITRREGADILIVDTHVFIRTPREYFIGLPRDVLDLLSPDVILVVTAKPEEIYQRRSQDSTRVREDFPPEEITLHQNLTIYGGAAAALYVGADLVIIENPQGAIDTAINKLFEIVKLRIKR